VTRLAAILLYGSGLRLLECLQLRVKDVDFAAHEIVIRGGKGDKDRVTMLRRQPGSRYGSISTKCKTVMHGRPDLYRSEDTRAEEASFSRNSGPASGYRSGAGIGHDEEGDMSHIPALICDPPARGRIRHPDGSGVAWSFRCADDDDLYSRIEPWWSWCSESG
jgi:hypothetical protein